MISIKVEENHSRSGLEMLSATVQDDVPPAVVQDDVPPVVEQSVPESTPPPQRMANCLFNHFVRRRASRTCSRRASCSESTGRDDPTIGGASQTGGTSQTRGSRVDRSQNGRYQNCRVFLFFLETPQSDQQETTPTDVQPSTTESSPLPPTPYSSLNENHTIETISSLLKNQQQHQLPFLIIHNPITKQPMPVPIISI